MTTIQVRNVAHRLGWKQDKVIGSRPKDIHMYHKKQGRLLWLKDHGDYGTTLYFADIKEPHDPWNRDKAKLRKLLQAPE